MIGFVKVVGFTVYEFGPHSPAFPYRVFRSRRAKAMRLAGFLYGFVTYLLLLWLPLFFQANLPAVLPLCCSLTAVSSRELLFVHTLVLAASLVTVDIHRHWIGILFAFE